MSAPAVLPADVAVPDELDGGIEGAVRKVASVVCRRAPGVRLPARPTLHQQRVLPRVGFDVRRSTCDVSVDVVIGGAVDMSATIAVDLSRSSARASLRFAPCGSKNGCVD